MVRKIEPVIFVLQKSPKAKPFVVHVNKLRCFSPTSLSWLDAEKGVEVEANVISDGVSQDFCEAAEPSSSTTEDAQQTTSSDVNARRRRRPQYLSDYVFFFSNE